MSYPKIYQKSFAFYIQRGILLLVTQSPGITRREMADRLNCGASTIQGYIKLMVASGSLLEEPGTCGTLRVTVPHYEIQCENAAY